MPLFPITGIFGISFAGKKNMIAIPEEVTLTLTHFQAGIQFLLHVANPRRTDTATGKTELRILFAGFI